METFFAILFFALGAALGAGWVWRYLNLERERRIAAEARLAAEQEAQSRVRDTFHSMASEALERSNNTFLTVAKQTLQPLRESLTAVDSKIHQLEAARTSAYSVLSEQVRDLHSETANLAKALRAPATRGRWGEIQLKRAVEMAGMVEYCDFCQQQTIDTGEGRLRPDLIVQMPNGRRVVVDAKVPLAAYLDGLESEDDSTRLAKMRAHAGQVRTHIIKLSAKTYWAQFDRAPEFVVAFLPGESIYSAALQYDPDLIQFGVDQRVLLATPMTLIALLKTVAHGWREDQIAQSAMEVSKLGKQLYERLASLTAHFCKVGEQLEKATKSYNDAVGTLEHRVLPAARRMREHGVSVADEIPAIDPVDLMPRQVSVGEARSNPPM